MMVKGLKGLRVQVSEAAKGADEEVKVHRDMQLGKVELRRRKNFEPGHPLEQRLCVLLEVFQGLFCAREPLRFHKS